MRVNKNISYIFLALVSISLLLSFSCSKPTRTALPGHLIDEAEIIAMPGVRDWGDEYSQVFQDDAELSIKQYIDQRPEGKSYDEVELNVLALSGGGSNGAFSVGLLNGWQAEGSLPEFKLVTGISTGSLIAPFAFLGGKYVPQIGQLYTNITTDQILKQESLFSIIKGTPYIADTTPLAELMERVIDEQMLNDIAKAHREGRRLFIGTTNLDAQRLVIWNMGAIANSDHPDALELFRKILRASASMPIAFPPMMFEVKAGDSFYDEMHVDGGASAEVFFYGDLIDIDKAHDDLKLNEKPTARIFILRSGQFKHKYKEVDMSLISIAGKTATSLTSSQGIGDLYRIYAISQRDGIDYNVAAVPDDFESQATEPFDPKDMKRLYKIGYDMAINGYPWQKYPPGYQP
ncbi:MAG: patatin-like phospholipase family protein [Thermodesulfobacteriota bacterium]